jgi:GT2 family glycosyltransferase
MSESVEISVVIPTHQRRSLVLRVLESLAVQTVGPDRYELVLVCDGCTDGTPEAVRAARGSGAPLSGLQLKIVEQPHFGLSRARNRGVEESSAPLLLFLDDDMFAEPELIETHLARHLSQPGCLVMGAIPVHPESPRSFMTVGLARWAERRHELLSSSGKAVPPLEMLCGHMSSSRENFELLGGFDTKLTAGGSFGGEDLDFGWRARERGIPIVYEPHAVALQLYSKGFPALAQDIRQSATADLYLVAKHPEAGRILRSSRLGALGPWQTRFFRSTLAAPLLSRLVVAPLLAFMAVAAHLGLKGKFLEKLHGLSWAHLYGLGIRDKGISAKELDIYLGTDIDTSAADG